jgi:pyruvate dehydrogenase (quinone)
VTWEMRAMAGEPKYEASQSLPDFPYAGYAESIGLAGIKVERPEDLGDAWDRAFASNRPVVLEVRTDPNVPPLPPHITFKQATAYMKAITKGDPEAWAMVRQSFREMADSFVPRT